MKGAELRRCLHETGLGLLDLGISLVQGRRYVAEVVAVRCFLRKAKRGANPVNVLLRFLRLSLGDRKGFLVRIERLPRDDLLFVKFFFSREISSSLYEHGVCRLQRSYAGVQ